jgi:hypothetical protein
MKSMIRLEGEETLKEIYLEEIYLGWFTGNGLQETGLWKRERKRASPLR